ncbi:tryptophan synthase beta subunit-like PLP-dependent enzyme [Favolaschia claudopus]|uniref:threonine synthase n=1 Tax=Favolaschia claudopus TaxID=2862362 RepID=A0AAW0B3F5_9AGAR
MSSTHRMKRKPLSYIDIVRCFNELDADFKDASRNLALSTVQLLQGYDSISMQLHSVDLQAAMPPVKPQWKLIRKDYMELVCLLRMNAVTCSARIKMFCNVILPLSVRSSTSQSSRSHQEKQHVLQSFITISAEQAALTFQLAEKAVHLNSVASNFHTEIARASSQRASSGQRELQDLAQKISVLQTDVQNFKLSRPDATYLAFTAFRLIVSSGQQSSKMKLSRYPLTLDNDLSQISNLFQELDGMRNEVAHAQYTTQISHRKSDVLSQARTAISDLVPSQTLMLEGTLNLFAAIWLRLQTDSLDILNWVQHGREPPPCTSAYLNGSSTIYFALANILDTYAETIDPRQFNYFSTRGGNERLSFEETVLTGLAPNGGLYIPESIPALPADWQTQWKSYSFVELSVAVLSLYISREEISEADLRALVQKSYQSFRHPDVAPLKKLDDKRYVLELFHGPTFAFKDVALQLLGNLFEFFLLRRNARKASGDKQEKLTVVGATSGDTGSAAIYGLRNKANISIFILHPKGRVSPIQEAQMTTVTDANVHNIAVKGTFDDCQAMVKSLFGDTTFNATHRLGAVNSINWARILAQTVYYFLSYFHIQASLGPGLDVDKIDIQYVVPTGNFGDILAGYYAKRMGLPMAKLVVATNANDILARFWNTGRYETVDSAPEQNVSDGKQGTASSGVKETLSPAMDIVVSSNFERLLWYLAYENVGDGQSDPTEAACATLAEWMSKMKSDGRVAIPVAVLESARRDFSAERISDEQTLATIQTHFEATPSYVVDPHTAVGLAAGKIVASKQPSSSTYQIMLSTAHPAKFSEAVTLALRAHSTFNFEKDVLPTEFVGLLEKKRNVIDVPRPDIDLVKAVIESFAEKEPVAQTAVVGV